MHVWSERATHLVAFISSVAALGVLKTKAIVVLNLHRVSIKMFLLVIHFVIAHSSLPAADFERRIITSVVGFLVVLHDVVILRGVTKFVVSFDLELPLVTQDHTLILLLKRTSWRCFDPIITASTQNERLIFNLLKEFDYFLFF